jgi:hypothetical protein
MAAKRILLVEDDAHLAGLLLFVLQGAGYISLILPSRWLALSVGCRTSAMASSSQTGGFLMATASSSLIEPPPWG